MFQTIKQFFKKEPTYACIIWNGKTMSYRDLTQKQIDEINNDEEKYKGWHVTLQE